MTSSETPSNDVEARTRLGQIVKDRRLELRTSVRAAATKAGVARDTWTGLEEATRRTAEHAWAGIEQALQWAPGSIKAILDGGQATLAPTQTIATAANPIADTEAQAIAGIEEDDPIIRIALSDMDEETKKVIVATLLAERKQFVRRRAAELVRDALQNQPTPPAAG